MRGVTIAISDLHVGAGVLDDCDAELESSLVRFINDLGANRGSVELVINGDFLDFAQAPPWAGPELESMSPTGIPLCFTENQSLAKLDAIRASHPTVFEALAAFLAVDAQNRLVILPGNHDADFFWPQVRARFAAAFPERARSRLHFHLERVYRPPAFPNVWIEHGHQYDPVNRFRVDEDECWSLRTPPIFLDNDVCLRLYECTGTGFLIKFLNRLDAAYPFVDNVKPFSRFLKLFAMSALVPGHGPLKVAVAIWGLLRYLARMSLTAPRDLLASAGDRLSPGALLLKWYEDLPAAGRHAFTEALGRAGFGLNRSLPLYVSDSEQAERLFTFLTDHLDILEGIDDVEPALLDLSGVPGTLTLAGGYNVDETAELMTAAHRILERGAATAVVMGHTHQPISAEGSLPYVNTGTWTRYYRFGSRDRVRSWALLKRDAIDHFPYQLNYAEIAGHPEPILRLVTHEEQHCG